MGTAHYFDLYLVRHGVTKSNLEKRYLGHTNEPLHKEMIHLLDPLKAVIEPLKFKYCFSSDLIRCVETFQYLLPHRMVCLEPRLRELHFGKWEGLTFEDLNGDPEYQKWLKDWENIAPPEGESYVDLSDRIYTYLTELSKSLTSSNVIVITHGGVIRTILKLLDCIDEFWDADVHHGGAYHLKIQVMNNKICCHSWSPVLI